MRTEIIEFWNEKKSHHYGPWGAIGFPEAVC